MKNGSYLNSIAAILLMLMVLAVYFWPVENPLIVLIPTMFFSDKIAVKNHWQFEYYNEKPLRR